MRNYFHCVALIGICAALVAGGPPAVQAQAPSLSVSNVTIVAGKLFTLPLDGSDPNGQPLTFSVISNSMSNLTTQLVTTNRTLDFNVSVMSTVIQTNVNSTYTTNSSLGQGTNVLFVSSAGHAACNGTYYWNSAIVNYAGQTGTYTNATAMEIFISPVFEKWDFSDNTDDYYQAATPNGGWTRYDGVAPPPNATFDGDTPGALVITTNSVTTYATNTTTNATGDLMLELFEHLTPVTTARIIGLVHSNFYNGLLFFRVIQNFMAQGGDPFNNGTGGSGLMMDDEFVPGLTFAGFGQFAMANSGFRTAAPPLGRDNNDSQFFITAPNLSIGSSAPPPQYLNYRYTIFGQLTHGFNLFGQLMAVPVDTNNRPLSAVMINSATIITNRQATVLYMAAPTNATGIAILTVQARSSGGTTRTSFRVTITTNTVNDPPFLSPMPVALVTTQSVTTSFPFGVWDANNDSLNLGLWDANTGGWVTNVQASLNNGILYLTPNVGFSGSEDLLFGVWDNYDHNGDGISGASGDIQEYDTQRVLLTVEPAQTTVLLQAGNGGMAGLWTLGTNYLPTAWASVTGALGSGWVLRAIDQNRILLQQGDGGAMTLWNLDANGAPASSSTISPALPGWIARDLDGNRVLLQAGDGGMIGIWTLGPNNTPVAWSTVNGAVSGLIARALCGPRLLVQFGTTTTMGYWTLNSGNAVTAWTSITSSLPAGWILRSLAANHILLQQGDGGTTALWDLDVNGQPIAQHTISSPLSGWIMRGMDLTLLSTLTVSSSTNLGGTITGSGTYSSGASVVLTATASNGWLFTGWNDGVTNNPRQVTIAAGGGNYTANFAPGITVTLQANPANSGTLTGAGTYGAGALVSLDAHPTLGWKFTNWSDGFTNQIRQIILGGDPTNLTANFVSAPLSVLLQAGDGGMAGLWGLGTNYLPATWSPITGALGSNWILRAINQSRALMQQGTGGKIEIWDLNTNAVPTTKWPVYPALSGWIARNLDGNRILLQAGDGGMVGLWTLSTNNTPASWSSLNGAVPGLIARSLCGSRILVQFGGGTLMGYWTLNGSNAITAWTPLTSGLPAGWVLRSMTSNYILLQAGDGGMAGMWDLDANGNPSAWHVISGAMPGWILRGIDQP